MDFGFERKRLNEFSEEKILSELENAAQHFNYIEFGRRDFDKVANISSSAIRRHYKGSWVKALQSLKVRLQTKGLDLKPRPHAPNRIISDKELFDEMERVWGVVGQRPSRIEWENAEPKVAYGTYKRRFGGWTNACSKFIEYKMGDSILADDFITADSSPGIPEKDSGTSDKKINSRDIPLSLRLKILNRDNFRCVFCGKSPATDFGTKLHIDHIIPFSKGGQSILENLQTLCEECNLGKSNQNITLPAGDKT